MIAPIHFGLLAAEHMRSWPLVVDPCKPVLALGASGFEQECVVKDKYRCRALCVAWCASFILTANH